MFYLIQAPGTGNHPLSSPRFFFFFSSVFWKKRKSFSKVSRDEPTVLSHLRALEAEAAALQEKRLSLRQHAQPLLTESQFRGQRSELQDSLVMAFAQRKAELARLGESLGHVEALLARGSGLDQPALGLSRITGADDLAPREDKDHEDDDDAGEGDNNNNNNSGSNNADGAGSARRSQQKSGKMTAAQASRALAEHRQALNELVARVEGHFGKFERETGEFIADPGAAAAEATLFQEEVAALRGGMEELLAQAFDGVDGTQEALGEIKGWIDQREAMTMNSAQLQGVVPLQYATAVTTNQVDLVAIEMEYLEAENMASAAMAALAEAQARQRAAGGREAVLGRWEAMRDAAAKAVRDASRLASARQALQVPAPPMGRRMSIVNVERSLAIIDQLRPQVAAGLELAEDGLPTDDAIITAMRGEISSLRAERDDLKWRMAQAALAQQRALSEATRRVATAEAALASTRAQVAELESSVMESFRRELDMRTLFAAANIKLPESATDEAVATLGRLRSLVQQSERSQNEEEERLRQEAAKRQAEQRIESIREHERKAQSAQLAADAEIARTALAAVGAAAGPGEPETAAARESAAISALQQLLREVLEENEFLLCLLESHGNVKPTAPTQRLLIDFFRETGAVRMPCESVAVQAELDVPAVVVEVEVPTVVYMPMLVNESDDGLVSPRRATSPPAGPAPALPAAAAAAAALVLPAAPGSPSTAAAAASPQATSPSKRRKGKLRVSARSDRDLTLHKAAEGSTKQLLQQSPAKPASKWKSAAEQSPRLRQSMQTLQQQGGEEQPIRLEFEDEAAEGEAGDGQAARGSRTLGPARVSPARTSAARSPAQALSDAEAEQPPQPSAVAVMEPQAIDQLLRAAVADDDERRVPQALHAPAVGRAAGGSSTHTGSVVHTITREVSKSLPLVTAADADRLLGTLTITSVAGDHGGQQGGAAAGARLQAVGPTGQRVNIRGPNAPPTAAGRTLSSMTVKRIEHPVITENYSPMTVARGYAQLRSPVVPGGVALVPARTAAIEAAAEARRVRRQARRQAHRAARAKLGSLISSSSSGSSSGGHSDASEDEEELAEREEAARSIAHMTSSLPRARAAIMDEILHTVAASDRGLGADLGKVADMTRYSSSLPNLRRRAGQVRAAVNAELDILYGRQIGGGGGGDGSPRQQPHNPAMTQSPRNGLRSLRKRLEEMAELTEDPLRAHHNLSQPNLQAHPDQPITAISFNSSPKSPRKAAKPTISSQSTSALPPITGTRMVGQKL